MSLLSRFARSKDGAAPVVEPQADCCHLELAPRWDNASDMGKKDKIVSFTCTTCKDEITPQEAERLGVA